MDACLNIVKPISEFFADLMAISPRFLSPNQADIIVLYSMETLMVRHQSLEYYKWEFKSPRSVSDSQQNK